MSSYRILVKEKGRAVLPAALRQVCAFDVGDELIAVPVGPGRFMVETRQAVLDRIGQGLPDGEGTAGTEDLEAWRQHSEEGRRGRLDSAVVSDPAASDARTAAMLAELGID